MLLSFPCFSSSFCESHILEHNQRWVVPYRTKFVRAVDAYPDRIRIGIKMMQILMRILPQVFLILVNPNFF
jgi:hypothetical protein